MHKNEFLFLFPSITNFANFLQKNVDANRTRGVCYVIYTFFGSPPQLAQVSSLRDMYNRF